MGDGDVVRWPSFSRVLDFELELGVVVASGVRDCSPREGRSAIGGFTVINDWTARDTQWDDTRNGTFGGVFKAKTFAGAMAATVVTSDEVLDRWTALRGHVRVNGETWCEGTTASAQHDLGDAVAYAAAGESLSAATCCPPARCPAAAASSSGASWRPATWSDWRSRGSGRSPIAWANADRSARSARGDPLEKPQWQVSVPLSVNALPATGTNRHA